MRASVWTIVALGWSAAWAGPVSAQEDAKKFEETVAAQKKSVEETWKRVMGDATVVQHETEHFLFYGTLDKAEMETLAKAVEKTWPTLKKQTAFGAKNEAWPGKLVICVFSERNHFAVWLRNVEKRMVAKTDIGSYRHEREMSIVSAGPPAAAVTGFALDLEVVNQVASAAISKARPSLPNWVVTGFGRSAMYRYAPKQASDERKAAAALVKLGRTAKDVWEAKLSADEAVILNGSFVDFLANSQQVGKFFHEIMENTSTETPFEDALKAAKLSADQVDRAWQLWAASQR